VAVFSDKQYAEYGADKLTKDLYSGAANSSMTHHNGQVTARLSQKISYYAAPSSQLGWVMGV